MINIDRLIAWLNLSATQATNNPLYQVIFYLIKAVKELQNETNAAISDVSGTVTGFEDLNFLTHGDESATLPNSRQLVAGTGVTFDDTVVNQRIVNVVTGGGFYDSPLTDGDEDETELIFASGDCVIVQVPIP